MTVCKRLILALLLLVIPLLLPADRITTEQSVDVQVAALVRGYEFNLLLWEVQALAGKVRDLVVQPSRGHDDASARQAVLDYVATAQRIAELEAAIARSASVSGQLDPHASIAHLQDELTRLRRLQGDRRPSVEATLESQVTAILAEQALTTVGFVWPPLKFSFSEPPLYLIISPRDRIVLRKGVHLRSDVPMTNREQLEDTVDSHLPDYVALVEDIGGFGTYPTMVLDNASLSWILDTIAHEWMHNYLAFRPLGWHYFADPEAVTLNETVASIVGEEIGALALQRYYPERVPTPRPSLSERRPLRIPDLVPTRLDFNTVMRNTRLRVDQLLSEGRILEAEALMEDQRRLLEQDGYTLRKLNQAYFAFHGSYATAPSAVDPIGPKMTALREAQPSLRDFLLTVSRFTTVEDLDRALAALEAQ